MLQEHVGMPAGESPWEHNADLLDGCLNRIAERLDTFTDRFGGYTTTEHEFESSDRPFGWEAVFFGEVVARVEFQREGSQLRYVSHIARGRLTLSHGPTGLIDVSNGMTAAGNDIDTAFAEIVAFLDASEPVIRKARLLSGSI